MRKNTKGFSKRTPATALRGAGVSTTKAQNCYNPNGVEERQRSEITADFKGYSFIPNGSKRHNITDIIAFKATLKKGVSLPALIRQKCDMIASSGVKPSPKSKGFDGYSDKATVSNSEAELLWSLLQDKNPEGKTLREIYVDMVHGVITYGTDAILMKETSIGNNSQKTLLRLDIQRYYLTTDEFSIVNGAKVSFGMKTMEIPLYPNSLEVSDKGVTSKYSVLLIADEKTEYFDYPSWYSETVILGCETEWRYAAHQNYRTANGFKLGGVLTLFSETPAGLPVEVQTNGEKTETYQIDPIEKQVQGLSVKDNGRYIISVQQDNGDGKAAKFDPFPTDEPTDNTVQLKKIEQQAAMALQWSLAFAGQSIAGTLGSNQQLKNEWQILESRVAPTRAYLDAKFYDTLIFWLSDGKISDATLRTNPSTLDMLISDIDINQILKDDEKRILINYPPIGDTGTSMPNA